MPRIDYRDKDGKRLPGVTTVIGSNLGWNSRALIYWSWDLGRQGLDYREVSKDACDIGTLIHAWVEADIRGHEPPPVPDNMREAVDNAVLGWLHWKDMSKFKAVRTECSLVSSSLGFGGTFDFISVMGRNVLSDLKSSKDVYPDHKIQIASYRYLWENADLWHNGKEWVKWESDSMIDGLALLQVGKMDGSFHYHFWHELSKGWEAFQHLLALHKLAKELK